MPSLTAYEILVQWSVVLVVAAWFILMFFMRCGCHEDPAVALQEASWLVGPGAVQRRGKEQMIYKAKLALASAFTIPVEVGPFVRDEGHNVTQIVHEMELVFRCLGWLVRPKIGQGRFWIVFYV